MFLRYGHDGTTHHVTVTGSGGVIRVAVGSPEAHSSIWRIWANKGTSDVYVAPREAASQQKFSLHQSGRWRYAYTSEHFKTLAFDDDKPRTFDRWERPEPAENGWVRGLSIWVSPEDVVAPAPSERKHNGVTWLRPPDPGHLVGIHLALVHPDRGVAEVAGLRPVDVLALADGTALIVLVGQAQPSDAARAAFEAARSTALAQPPVDLTPGDRLWLFGHDDAGHRFVRDTAITASDLAQSRQ